MTITFHHDIHTYKLKSSIKRSHINIIVIELIYPTLYNITTSNYDNNNNNNNNNNIAMITMITMITVITVITRYDIKKQKNTKLWHD